MPIIQPLRVAIGGLAKLSQKVRRKLPTADKIGLKREVSTNKA